MKGIVQGQRSSATNPVLVLFCRMGDFLDDILSGTYRIDCIAGETATTVVAEAPFNVLPIAQGGHKVGGGRYYIPTGNTATWTLGTYRAVAIYQHVLAGPSYTQVLEFELLSSADWVDGKQFVSYASSRRLLQENIVRADLPIATIHRATNRVSVLIEQLCRRCFEPRYMTLQLDGSGNQFLFLPDAIIALDDVQIWDIYQSEVSSIYDRTSYLVYNRHLAQPGAGSDDRYNPKIERALWSVSRTMWSEGMPIKVGYYPWPEGRLNLYIAGVFGFTDPEPNGDPDTTLGRTPEDLLFVIGALVSRQLENPTFDSMLVHQPGRLKSMKTRDQSVTLAASPFSLSGSATGDPLLDQMLIRFAAPIVTRYTDQKRINTP